MCCGGMVTDKIGWALGATFVGRGSEDVITTLTGGALLVGMKPDNGVVIAAVVLCGVVFVASLCNALAEELGCVKDCPVNIPTPMVVDKIGGNEACEKVGWA